MPVSSMLVARLGYTRNWWLESVVITRNFRRLRQRKLSSRMMRHTTMANLLPAASLEFLGDSQPAVGRELQSNALDLVAQVQIRIDGFHLRIESVESSS